MGIWWSDADISASVHALKSAGLIDSSGLLTLLGEGFGSAALESQNGVVILVGKHEIGAESMRVSTALLPELGPAITVAIPEPLWSVKAADGLAWGAWAYEKLP